MANGIEQDVRELRESVQRIDRDGCGHKANHDRTIEKAHERITAERAAREKSEKDMREEMSKLKDSITIRIALAVLAATIINLAGGWFLMSKLANVAIAAASTKSEK